MPTKSPTEIGFAPELVDAFMIHTPAPEKRWISKGESLNEKSASCRIAPIAFSLSVVFVDMDSLSPKLFRVTISPIDTVSPAGREITLL